jgi:tetratricopeptide (TPR) repeat protein
MIGRTILHYTIHAELGAGAMGRVYLARDERTDRSVALKFIAPEAAAGAEARARLVREATAAARLSHPNIVSLHAAEEADGELFLVEEYVEGESLARRLERGPLGPQEVLGLARALASALAHAHQHGVLHRDLKPANVLIAADGTFKIADFGVARVEGAGTLTATGTVVGSLPYLAPERLRGAAGDARADLFALGAVLYEALTARRAFPGKTDAEVLHVLLNEEPRPPEVPTASLLPLATLVMKLLAKEPAERPPSAAALREALEMVRPTGPTVGRRRRAWLVPVAGAVVLVLALSAVWWARGRFGAPPRGEPSVAVLYFENVADPADAQRIGAITGNLLITSIAQDPGIQVVGTERILDALRGLGRSGIVDRGTAFLVARRVHAARIVTGRILQVQPSIVLTAEVSEVVTGRVLDAARIEGEPGQTVFQVVDALGAQLMSRMARPDETTRLAPVAQRTSADLEAQRLYAEGLEHLSGAHLSQAAASFRAALARDPEFAQASYQLAIVLWWWNDFEAAKSSLEHARARADRLSPMEREILAGLGALVDGRGQPALERFAQLSRQYPEEKIPAFGLIEATYHTDHYEEAVRAARRALVLDPSFTFAGVHLVDALRQLGRLDEADSTARILLARDPGNVLLWYSRQLVMLTRGDAQGALRLAEEAHAAGAMSPVLAKSTGLLLLNLTGRLDAARVASPEDTLPWQREERRLLVEGTLALRAGRFREAMGITRRAWVAVPRSTGLIPAASLDVIHAALGAGNARQALAWHDSLVGRLETAGPFYRVIGQVARLITLARLGRRAEAEALDRQLQAIQLAPGDLAAQVREYGHALLLQAQGRPREGLACLPQAWWGPAPLSWSGARLDRARMELDAGMYVAALGGLDTLLRTPLIQADDAVRLRLWRGQALEKLDRPAEAAASYRDFLRIWKDADPGVPEVAEAKMALARLEPASQTGATSKPRRP